MAAFALDCPLVSLVQSCNLDIRDASRNSIGACRSDCLLVEVILSPSPGKATVISPRPVSKSVSKNPVGVFLKDSMACLVDQKDDWPSEVVRVEHC